jgi:hypothetical protein
VGEVTSFKAGAELGFCQPSNYPMETLMVKVEIIGNEEAISAAKEQVDALSEAGVKQYRHKGLAGEVAIIGLIATISPAVIPALLDFLKSLIVKDRNLKISFDGFDISVQDVNEVAQVLDLLASKGILPKKG